MSFYELKNVHKWYIFLAFDYGIILVFQRENFVKGVLDEIRGKKKYDLILIEDNIKPLSGIIIMKKLLIVKSFNTKVILLSSNNEYIDNYDKYGFSDVISEPIDEDIFINKINKYLER